ncbi:MAG TPA: acetoacetate--CoA ligase [Vicinamibacterales bacterium]|nr:acetoacetate--CoA ligase [Vicinamibacterales bacterium]
MAAPLWIPSPERVRRARLTAFIDHVARATGRRLDEYRALHRFSVEHREAFWSAVWDFCGVIAEERGARVAHDIDAMPGARYFPDARLNFARNLLRRRDDGEAIVFQAEHGPRRTLTHRDLYDGVAAVAATLRAHGIRPGDRVGGYMPNVPETMIAALGAASVGAIWSSCSPDFGVQGVLDRFGQIEPRIVFSADGYVYGGKAFDSLEKVREIVDRLPSVERVIVLPYTREQPDISPIRRAALWPDAVATGSDCEIDFASLPFNHPLYILYSSGTTGAPKCIVHGAGGTLLQHLKEHQLHCDIHPGDRVFYFTTCGWMMWNWLLTALASGATLLLYDGSPFHPGGHVLFDFADATGMTLFGTSAKFIDAVNKAGLEPARTHSLAALRTMTSTGSPLAPESFDFVYRAIKRDLHLASISGGTDIISCFVGGNPRGAVWHGEIQARALGMDVDVFGEQGRPVAGEKGELVCKRSFPSMPVEFWNDAEGAKYRAAYFEKYPGVWAHGDYAEITPHDGVIIYGRSDAVLNPGGVRIGTAEIYRQVEQLPEILESLVIGQRWNGDERIVLFVRLREGARLDAELKQRIREHIRRNTTPRHVPAKIVQVPDIPRTKSGKITELAVREVVHGREVKNREALANPDALDLYRNLPELET